MERFSSRQLCQGQRSVRVEQFLVGISVVIGDREHASTLRVDSVSPAMYLLSLASISSLLRRTALESVDREERLLQNRLEL
jgi:hypothetical protein